MYIPIPPREVPAGEAAGQDRAPGHAEGGLPAGAAGPDAAIYIYIYIYVSFSLSLYIYIYIYIHMYIERERLPKEICQQALPRP